MSVVSNLLTFDSIRFFYLLSSAFDNYFLQAQRVRQLVTNDFDGVFTIPNVRAGAIREDGQNILGVDVLLHPSSIGAAPTLEDASSEQTAEGSALDAYVQDLLTVPASLAGLPALNIPTPPGADVEGDDAWPVGCSVVGQWGTDKFVLSIGEAISKTLSNAKQ